MRVKICPNCGNSFQCSTEKCWCAELPPIMPMNMPGDCYCPKCLTEAIHQKTKNSLNVKEKVTTKGEMIEDIDYYINENGLWVLTAEYHLKRGYCCENGCKHCPYGFHDNK